jgi:PIN domain nuclease of toxin-antitoxin system
VTAGRKSSELDASALLSILLDEPGQDRVNRIAARSPIHAVNLAEAIGRLVRSGMPADRRWKELDGSILGDFTIRVEAIR